MADSSRERILSILANAKDKLTPVTRTMRASLRLLKGTATRVFKTIARVARTAGRAIKAMLGPIGLLTTGLSVLSGVRVFSFAADVEEQTREIATLLGDVSDETLTSLSRDIRAAAAAGGQAFEAEFSAAYDAISAGVPAQKLLSFLGDANKLAVAGVTDVGTATDILTSVLNAYNLEASEAGRVSDVLFTTVRLGKTTIDELGANVGKVAPLARAAGLSIEEMGAGIAALTASGLSTEEATTRLNAALQVLIKLTDSQVEKSAAMGAELSLQALQTKGLAGFMRDLDTAMGGNLDTLGEFIPNVRALTGLLVLSADDAGKVTEAVEGMGEAAGATDQAFETMSKGAKFSFARLRGTIANIAVEVANVFLPGLQRAADNLNDDIKENQGTWIEWASKVKAGVVFAQGAVKAGMKLIRELLTDPSNAQDLGGILKDLSLLALGIARETVVAIAKIVFGAAKAQAKTALTIAKKVGGDVGTAILGGIVKPLALLPFRAVEAIEAGRNALIAKVPALQALFLPGGPLFAFGFTSSAASAGATALKDEVEDLIDGLIGTAGDGGAAIEELVGVSLQRLVEQLQEQLSSAGTAVSEALVAIDEELTAFAAKLADRGETNEDVAEFLARIAQLKAEFDAAKTAAEEAGRAFQRSAAGANDNLAVGSGSTGEDLKAVGETSDEVVGKMTTGWAEFWKGFKSGGTQAIKTAKQWESEGKKFANALGATLQKGVGDVLGAIVDETVSVKQALKSLAADTLRVFGQLLTKLIVSGLLGGGGGASIPGAARGGMVTGGGSVPIAGFAQGGLTKGGGGTVGRPTLFAAGEGTKREAIIPLPDGRHVEAVVRDEGAPARDVRVNFTINAMDGPSVERVLMDKAKLIQAIIKKALANENDMRNMVRNI